MYVYVYIYIYIIIQGYRKSSACWSGVYFPASNHPPPPPHAHEILRCSWGFVVLGLAVAAAG